MFIGRYYFHLEEKGRLSLPKEFRQASPSWIVTRGLDGGLFVFKQAEFEKQITQLSERTFTKKLHRDFVRLMTNDAVLLTPDKLGRVSLPEYLIERGGLSKNVVIVGSFSYLEIWDQQTYHTYLEKLEPEAEKLAEQLLLVVSPNT